jgi:small subunit ribosomal protein S17
MKKLQGTVTSLKNAQTAAVQVTRRFQHPLFKKYLSRHRQYACHYEDLTLNLGDLVEIAQTKPISKTKHFKIVGIVKK